MNTTAQQILAKIAKAREAEKNVSPAPWRHCAVTGGWDGVEQVGGPELLALRFNEPKNAAFIASARTDLPKCWEALEVAVEALSQIEKVSIALENTLSSKALSKVNSILARP